jgi:hypothetical protein
MYTSNRINTINKAVRNNFGIPSSSSVPCVAYISRFLPLHNAICGHMLYLYRMCIREEESVMEITAWGQRLGRWGVGLIWEHVISHISVNSKTENIKLTTANCFLAVTYYVAYRSPKPDAATVKVVKTVLQNYNIDVSQLLEWPTDHC